MSRFARLLALMLVTVSSVLATGCVEFFDALEIIAFEESDNPELQKTGQVLREIKEEREVREALDQFVATGDRSHLERARAIRPDDTSVAGYDVVLATLTGTPDEIETAKRRLIEAEARRLGALNRPGDPPITAQHVRRNAMGEILVAQINMLGGSLSQQWQPPGPDAPEQTQRLYRDYCATRTTIQTEYNDSLSYLPNPPCPSA